MTAHFDATDIQARRDVADTLTIRLQLLRLVDDLDVLRANLDAMERHEAPPHAWVLTPEDRDFEPARRFSEGRNE